MALSAVSSTASSIRQMIPFQDQIAERFSISIPDIAKNLNRVVIPAIAFIVSSNLAGAEAGPLSYGVCVAACMSLATPVLMPACTVGCLALAGPWCP